VAAILLAGVSVASVFFLVAAEVHLEGPQVDHQAGHLGRQDQQVDHPVHSHHPGDQAHVDQRLNDRLLVHH
jgi:hypothetical protein